MLIKGILKRVSAPKLYAVSPMAKENDIQNMNPPIKKGDFNK
jgi:hypothetical protein